MLKAYDPRRYGPASSGEEERKRAPPSPPCGVGASSENLENCAFAAYDPKQEANVSNCFGFGDKHRDFAPLLYEWYYTKHYFSGVNKFALPADGSRNGSAIGPNRPYLQPELASRSQPGSAEIRRGDHVDSIPQVTSNSTLELATAGPSMSWNRKTSIAWHSREWLRRASSLRPSTSGSTTEVRRGGKGLAMNDFKTGNIGGRNTEIKGRIEGVMKKMGGVNVAGKRVESIDAVQLFHRKKQFKHNITYAGWTEKHDRKMAKLAAPKRKQRKEVERQEDLRRQRAEAEFQKWLCQHAASPPKVQSRTEEQGAKIPRQDQRNGYTEVERKGTGCKQHCRDVVREGPLKPCWRSEDSANREDESEDDIESQALVGETKGQWPDEKTMTTEGAEEMKQREIDQAFRKWLERKRKQSERERLTREQRNSASETQRKLEASQRWKKRPVVCAYTYGATLGAWQ